MGTVVVENKSDVEDSNSMTYNKGVILEPNVEQSPNKSESRTNGSSDDKQSSESTKESSDELITDESTNKDAKKDDKRLAIIPKVHRRVKVYLLKDEAWIDHGTGFCSGDIESDTNKPFFVVRNELDQEEIILKAYLEGQTQYQRQQDTLIVWTDHEGNDIALSFQETEGCADLCEFIIDVQRENYSPEISLYYVIPNTSLDDNGGSSDITQLVAGPITYPPTPSMTNLEEILEIINQCSTSVYTRNCIVNFVVEKDYFSLLLKIFEQSEHDHSLINLYTLSEIIKNLILYSESKIMEDFCSNEDRILGLISILEYDAEFPNQKSCHRDFLFNKAKFKVVISIPPLKDSKAFNIFKKDYYLTFLKDVVLARFIDDQTFSLLNSLIHMNQIAIIEFLKDSQNNDRFLEKLFGYYKDDKNVELKRNGIRLIHQYILLTKNLQSFQRTDFLSLLISNGLFDMIKYALNDDEFSIKILGTDLIVSIIEQDVSLVNSIDGEGIDNFEPPVNYSDKFQKAGDKKFGLKLSDDMTLITLLAQVLLKEKNVGLKMQAFQALKNLLDNNIGKIDENGTIPDFNATSPGSDISTESYFKAFYNGVAPILYKNIIEIANCETIPPKLLDKISSDELLYQQLCELVSFGIITHEKLLSRPFFLKNNIVLGLVKLLGINCKMTLKLSILTCLSNLLSVNDKFIMRYIIKNQVMDYYFEFFKTVNNANNLANSTCLSILEVLNDIRIGKNKSTFKLLIKYIHDNYKDFCLNEIEGVETGKNVISLYDQLDTSNLKINVMDSRDIPTDGDIIEEEDSDSEDDDDDDEFYDDYGEIYEEEVDSYMNEKRLRDDDEDEQPKKRVNDNDI
ncbi:serine/threonine-protein phosphatase 4 regulatory subunit 3 [[Candida] jaroonii]|uniref:Serine/threonine-protein phosphatase 4 regulatory subunit 3 n=1 Tax=[Candida] jaroonii TaxID=467808 RepID=A0ACA9Y920_9ASCO|nr:serine/threonine-protein phosphatase 4 regulatory subunit 3 [[Candida] jaroonii]